MPKNSGIAAVLSFLIWGAGQIYNGQLGKGIALFVGGIVFLALSFVLIGIPFLLILWVWGIYDAYSVAEQFNAREQAEASARVPGAGTPTSAGAYVPPVRVCLGCGTQLAQNVGFCSHCGKAVPGSGMT